MELDHSGEIENLLQRYPDVKIIGNVKTFKVLCGYLGQLPNLVEVKDGDTLRLGASSAEVYFHSVGALARNDDDLRPDRWNPVYRAMLSACFGALDGGVFDDQVDFAELS